MGLGSRRARRLVALNVVEDLLVLLEVILVKFRENMAVLSRSKVLQVLNHRKCLSGD